jgi:outer membrane protein assembly factor BamB
MSNRLAWVMALLCAGPACAPDRSVDTWQLRTPRPFLAGNSDAFTPAIGSDSIFFCGGYAYTAAAELVAVNAADGHPRWRFPLETCGDSPLLIDSTVVAFGQEPHTPRAVLYGLEALTGTEKWRKAVGAITAHARLGRFVFLALADGSLQRVDATNGQMAGVAVQRESADRWWLIATDAGLMVGAGESVWELADAQSDPVPGPRLQSSVKSVIAASAEGDRLVLQDRDNGLTAFQRSSGRLLWTRRWSRLLSEPTVSNGRVFINTFGPNRYELHAIDAATGRDLWTVKDGSFEAPTASNGRLYAAGRSSVLILDPETGVVVDRVKSETEIISSPTPFGEQVLFGTIDGVLHAASGR